jgi:hypothetical protein
MVSLASFARLRLLAGAPYGGLMVSLASFARLRLLAGAPYGGLMVSLCGRSDERYR